MANVYFETFDDVLNYREERLSFNIIDLYSSCSVLRSILKKDDVGFYRKGKSSPLIRDGDIIAVKTDDTFVSMAYNSSDDGAYPVITFEDIIGMDNAIYRDDFITNVIPPIKKASRKNLFSKEPMFSNNFLQAVYCITGILIENVIGKEHVIDYSHGLSDLLIIKEGTATELEEEARNYLFIEQVKSGKRVPINQETVDNVVCQFKEEYETLIHRVIEEVRCATYSTIADFVTERPCSRYHFNDHGDFFFVERGMDTRIYKWEQEKFSKLEEIEDTTGLKMDKIVSPWQSAKYDLF